jgi:hypothetical protein
VATRRGKIRVVDEFPDLVDDLDTESAELARHHLVAPLLVVERGRWQPRADLQPKPGHLGLLVLDGLLTRDVVMRSTLATELCGYGDLLRPADHDGQEAPEPFDVTWQVLDRSRIAVLDREFARALGHWPEAVEVVVRAGVRRAQTLAIVLAVSHLRRADVRLLVLMWYLADRWGRVRPDGVHLPLRLTHQVLGRLVGAQRPSVTTALKHLASEGMLLRERDGTWLLRGDPPETLERLREQVGDAH